MTTATKNKVKAEAPAEEANILSNMSVETELDAPLRGRGYSPEIELIADELEKCLADRSARSFQNVDQDDREVWARKVRTAGQHRGIKTATRYIKHANKLVWGPHEVLKELRSAPESTEDAPVEAEVTADES